MKNRGPKVLEIDIDAVLLHDAVSHMTTRGDVAAAVATAFAHTAPGGVALFQPDCVAETFAEGIGTGGSDDGGRGLRYLEWRFRPEPGRAEVCPEGAGAAASRRRRTPEPVDYGDQARRKPVPSP